jgi:Eco29kI restriction endonuclease
MTQSPVPLGESLLIATFRPVWNMLVDGFGHHDQGASRRGQMKSAWDTLHPGRSWSDKVERPHAKAVYEIESAVATYLSKIGVTGDPLK